MYERWILHWPRTKNYSCPSTSLLALDVATPPPACPDPKPGHPLPQATHPFVYTPPTLVPTSLFLPLACTTPLSSPGCREHRCGAQCFLRRSAPSYRLRRREDAPGAARGRSDMPAQEGEGRESNRHKHRTRGNQKVLDPCKELQKSWPAFTGARKDVAGARIDMQLFTTVLFWRQNKTYPSVRLSSLKTLY